MACGILVPQPGIEPVPPAVESWSPNHWTARELPILFKGKQQNSDTQCISQDSPEKHNQLTHLT